MVVKPISWGVVRRERGVATEEELVENMLLDAMSYGRGPKVMGETRPPRLRSPFLLTAEGAFKVVHGRMEIEVEGLREGLEVMAALGKQEGPFQGRDVVTINNFFRLLVALVEK